MFTKCTHPLSFFLSLFLSLSSQATLLMDPKFLFAVRFPFNPSTIQLEELEIPEAFNNLHNILKKL